MVIVKEYRVTLPLTVEEYMIAQLYAVVYALREKGSFDQAEVIKNEPFAGLSFHDGKYDHGRYEEKLNIIYHLHRSTAEIFV